MKNEKTEEKITTPPETEKITMGKTKPQNTGDGSETGSPEVEKEYKCNYCGRSFTSEPGLKRHITRAHKSVAKNQEDNEDFERKVKELKPQFRNFIKSSCDIAFERLDWKPITDFELDGLTDSTARVFVKYFPVVGDFSAEIALLGWLGIIIISRMQEKKKRDESKRMEKLAESKHENRE